MRYCIHLDGSTGEIDNGCPCDREKAGKYRQEAEDMIDEAKRLRSLADTTNTAEYRSYLIGAGTAVGGFIGSYLAPGPGTVVGMKVGAFGVGLIVGYIGFEQGEYEDECIERAHDLEISAEYLDQKAEVWTRGGSG